MQVGAAWRGVAEFLSEGAHVRGDLGGEAGAAGLCEMGAVAVVGGRKVAPVFDGGVAEGFEALDREGEGEIVAGSNFGREFLGVVRGVAADDEEVVGFEDVGDRTGSGGEEPLVVSCGEFPLAVHLAREKIDGAGGGDLEIAGYELRREALAKGKFVVVVFTVGEGAAGVERLTEARPHGHGKGEGVADGEPVPERVVVEPGAEAGVEAVFGEAGEGG